MVCWVSNNHTVESEDFWTLSDCTCTPCSAVGIADRLAALLSTVLLNECYILFE